MKKFLTVVLAVAIVCTTAACGASSNASAETAVTVPDSQTDIEQSNNLSNENNTTANETEEV